MKDVRWYHFWNPYSGLIGGVLFGAGIFFFVLGVVLIIKS